MGTDPKDRGNRCPEPAQGGDETGLTDTLAQSEVESRAPEVGGSIKMLQLDQPWQDKAPRDSQKEDRKKNPEWVNASHHDQSSLF
jgi:hypothetical protein